MFANFSSDWGWIQNVYKLIIKEGQQEGDWGLYLGKERDYVNLLLYKSNSQALLRILFLRYLKCVWHGQIVEITKLNII